MEKNQDIEKSPQHANSCVLKRNLHVHTYRCIGYLWEDIKGAINSGSSSGEKLGRSGKSNYFY